MKPYTPPFSWLATVSAVCWAAAAAPPDPPGDRLPGHTEPVSYDLRIRPVVDRPSGNCTFAGRVEIVIRANRYTDVVTVNSRELTVRAVSGLRDVRTGGVTPVAGFACDAPAERLVVRLGKPIVPRRLYRFAVEFGGTLRDDTNGFHKYFYDSEDDSRWIAMTQFKPIYARRTFPCYDEPKFKTPYKISIARQNGHFSLSNMPLNRTEIDSHDSGWTWDHFDTTEPIPTYLVMFMVSDFKKNTINNDKNIAVYTRSELIDNTVYMMEKVSNLLKNVEMYTQIPYMLPKLDLVGVPLLYVNNMGNWGLNSYKEFYLTLSNKSYTEDKILGTMTVLHEIIHQWFGNLVTIPWWDYAWLNQGICNYLKYYIADTIEPDWGLGKIFVENIHRQALVWDAYNDTHPLTYSMSTPAEIIDGFDTSTLGKSAAILRMLQHMVGDTNFRTSLNIFLSEFAYTQAGPKELWETFDNVLFDADYVIDDDVTVNNSMYLWTEQAGYPLVNVMITSDGSVVATQERFSLSNPGETVDDSKWFVGLTYTTEKDKRFDDLTPTIWLKPEEQQKTISVPADSGWVIFNLQSTGFYRVNYDEKNWKLLLIQFITKPYEIHVLNRAQIIDDAYHLCKAGLVPYNYYISLLEYLLMENYVTPWNTATGGLSEIMSGIRRYPVEYFKFKEYAKGLADILYGKLTDNLIDDGPTKIGQARLLTWSCKLGNEQCVKTASKQFNAWMNGQSIPSGMEESALCVGMKTGNLTAWSKLYKFYETTLSATYKQVALRALACVENDKILFNYLNLIVVPRLRDNANRPNLEDFKTVCENIVTTPQGVEALVNYLSSKLNAILSIKDGHLFASVAYSALASNVATAQETAIMNKIRMSMKSAGRQTAAFVDKHQRKILSNFEWMERDHKTIIKAISD